MSLLGCVFRHGDTVHDREGGNLRRWLNRALCVLLNGGHDLYRAHTDTRLYQQCVACGYETKGWTVDRRDRKIYALRKL